MTGVALLSKHDAAPFHETDVGSDCMGPFFTASFLLLPGSSCRSFWYVAGLVLEYGLPSFQRLGVCLTAACRESFDVASASADLLLADVRLVHVDRSGTTGFLTIQELASEPAFWGPVGEVIPGSEGAHHVRLWEKLPAFSRSELLRNLCQPTASHFSINITSTPTPSAHYTPSSLSIRINSSFSSYCRHKTSSPCLRGPHPPSQPLSHNASGHNAPR